MANGDWPATGGNDPWDTLFPDSIPVARALVLPAVLSAPRSVGSGVPRPAWAKDNKQAIVAVLYLDEILRIIPAQNTTD